MKRNDEKDIPSLPPALSAALSRNIGAMSAFAAMSDERRQTVIDEAPREASKKEMRAYVAGLSQKR